MTPRLAKTAARQVAGAKQLDSRRAGVWTAATENSCDERRWNDRRDDCDCDSSGATWRRLSLRVWSRSVKCEQLVNDRPTTTSCLWPMLIADMFQWAFLADRAYGRAYATVLRPSVRLSVCT